MSDPPSNSPLDPSLQENAEIGDTVLIRRDSWAGHQGVVEGLYDLHALCFIRIAGVPEPVPKIRSSLVVIEKKKK